MDIGIISTFNAVMNICVQVSVWTWFLFLLYTFLGVKLLIYVVTMFLMTCQTVFLIGCIISHSHQPCMRVAVSPHPYRHLLWSLFDCSHPRAREVGSPFGFDLLFPKAWWCRASPMCFLLAIGKSSLEKCVFRFFVHFLIGFFVVVLFYYLRNSYISSK